MIKLYRGDVIEMLYPAGFDALGKPIFKPRPVVVLRNTSRRADIISVYCTSQNPGDEANTIFVAANSKEGIEMELTKDTWIMPNKIKTLPSKAFKRLMGKCSLM